MAGVTILLWVYLCMFVLLLTIPVMIGVYVYRDASRRRMNAVLWTLVTVAAPVFTGLIIYLLVRGNYPGYTCPSCGAGVEASYTVCPRCGVRLRRACDACGFPLEEDWKVCPRCAHPAEKGGIPPQPPVRKKDRGLWRLLAAVLLLPAACLILLLVINITANRSGASSMGSTSYAAAEMERYRTERPEVWAWIEECRQQEGEQDPDVIYVLRNQVEKEDGKESRFLIYRQDGGYLRQVNMRVKDRLAGSTLVVSFEVTDEEQWSYLDYPMEYVRYRGDRFVGLDIQVNGEGVGYVLKDVDFDLELPEPTAYSGDM